MGTAAASRSSVVWRFLRDPWVSPPFHPGPRSQNVRTSVADPSPGSLGDRRTSSALRPQSPIGEQDSGLSALPWVGLESSRRGAKIALLLPLNSPALTGFLRRPGCNARGSAGGPLLQRWRPAGHGHARGGRHRRSAGLAHVVALLVLSPETQRVDPAQKTTDLFSTLTTPSTPSPAPLLPLLLA